MAGVRVKLAENCFKVSSIRVLANGAKQMSARLFPILYGTSMSQIHNLELSTLRLVTRMLG